MDFAKVDLLVQYALAASALEDFPDNQLGPIHVLKYVYLADLAWSEKEGSTFTGADWLFYDFGPWAPAVHDRIQDAAVAAGAEVRRLESQQGREFVRYAIRDRALRDSLEPKLPIAVSRAIDRAVKKFGASTPDLLDHVYLTEPLRTASPGELLRFSCTPSGATTARDTGTSRPSAKTIKRRNEKVRSMRERVRNIREGRAEQAAGLPSSPRYDMVFRDGRRWLDELSPGPLDDTDVNLVVDPSVWKSAIRTDGDVP